jgi:hypothetical protein
MMQIDDDDDGLEEGEIDIETDFMPLSDDIGETDYDGDAK